MLIDFPIYLKKKLKFDLILKNIYYYIIYYSFNSNSS